MSKLAVRLLILSMFPTSLLATPIVTGVSAATTTKQTSTKHMKKKKVRMTHQSPRAADPYASPFGNRYEDDPDRRAGGGGGGY